MPRACALDLLQDVLVRKRPLDDAIAQHARLKGLDPRDRGFARVLVSETLRHLGEIDAVLDQCLEKPLPRKAIAVRDILRLGAVQLLFLGTPAHAAVDTAVTLAAERRLTPYKKLINAILRRIGRAGKDMLAGQDAARLNTPGWLWDSWVAAYGEDTARAIAEAQASEPPLDLSVKSDPATWAETLAGEVTPTGAVRLREHGAVPDLSGFHDGAWWVQDMAAALPVRLLGDVAGLAVADLCAAPGGKTVQLAARGARVIAIDRSEKRLLRVRENLERLKLAADTVAADAAHWSAADPLDAILLDAPCSATGTIRRHPDVARLKSPEDVAGLANLQGRLLDHACELLKPGGTLVYCTCSLQPEEGEAQIAALLKRNSGVERVPVTADEVGGLHALISPDGDLRTLPCHWSEHGGMDGFFAARLTRT